MLEASLLVRVPDINKIIVSRCSQIFTSGIGALDRAQLMLVKALRLHRPPQQVMQAFLWEHSLKPA